MRRKRFGVVSVSFSIKKGAVPRSFLFVLLLYRYDIHNVLDHDNLAHRFIR